MDQDSGSDSDDVVSVIDYVPPRQRMLDAAAQGAKDTLRQLHGQFDVAFHTAEAQNQLAEDVVNPGDMQYRKDIHLPASSTVAVNAVTDYTTGLSKPAFDQYQKHCYNPRSTRSMTHPSRSYHTEDELEEEQMTETAVSVEEPDIPRIQAFAKLEFEDGEFYMNTYSVELGRDLYSARQAAEANLAKRRRTKRKKTDASSGDAAHVPRKIKREHNRSHPGSIVSESGGVIAVDHSDAEDSGDHCARRAGSTSTSSQQMSRKSSMLFTPNPTSTDYQSLAMASLGIMDPNASRPYDRSNPPVPAPNACPLIPIHPPMKRQTLPEAITAELDGVGAGSPRASVGRHNAISRKHVRIAYNFERSIFEVHVLGRNGIYIGECGSEEYLRLGDVRQLTNNTAMLIGGVSVKFLLPDAGPCAEVNGNANHASGISGDYNDQSSVESSENGQGDHNRDSESEEDSDTGKTSQERSPEQKAPPSPQPKAKTQTRKVKTGKPAKNIPKPEIIEPVPRRRGPGRPPKNGVMSKKDMKQLEKKNKEEAAELAAQIEANGKPSSGKSKNAKVSNEKSQDPPPAQPVEKRKYTKRKGKVDATQEPQETRESIEQAETVLPEQVEPPKPLKEKKPPKPPRSPSPFIDPSTLTEEQKAKPAQSYVVLIHEALSESEKGPMSLNQIYKAIAYKYPYFKFIVTTVGWQSSIRHNLLQHEAFEKVEREGKGWMWGLKPGVSIEKEKKRRPTPPHTTHHYYPPHGMPPQFGYYPGVHPPPNGQAPYHPHYGPPPHGLPAMQHGMPQGYSNYQPGYYPPPPRPHGLPMPLINATADSSSTYQSPYAAESSQTNGQQPPPPQQAASQQPVANGYHNDNNENAKPSPSTSDPKPQQPNSTQLPERVRQAVDRFKDVLLSTMTDKAFGELVIDSAIARIFRGEHHSSLPDQPPGAPDNSQELLIMDALQNIFKRDGSKTAAEGEANAVNNAAAGVVHPSPDRDGISHEQPASNGAPATEVADKAGQETTGSSL